MDSSIFDPDVSTEPGSEELEADYCVEPPESQVNQGEDGGEGMDESGDFEGWEEGMEAIEQLPVYDPDLSYGASNLSSGVKTPPDASFGAGEEEEDHSMGDPSKLSSIGGFFSDNEEEPEPRHPPKHYEETAAESPEAEFKEDLDGEGMEEPEEIPPVEEELDEGQMEAYFEAADAELAAQVQAQQQAQAAEGGAELMRQISGGDKAKLLASVPLVRAPDSSSREPEFEEEADDVVPKKGDVEFQRAAPKTAGGRYRLMFQGYMYSVSKPAKENVSKKDQRWRMRCSNHGPKYGCNVSFFVDGFDNMIDNPIKLFEHKCGRPDKKELAREKIRGLIRDMVAKAFMEGHYYRFSVEVKKVYKKLSDVELRVAEWALVDLAKYAYTHSRWKLSLPAAPVDFRFQWPDDKKFLMRDPGHVGTKKSVLLWDSEVIEFKTREGGMKDGRICVLGEEFIRGYVERGVVDGALIDGTYACCPKGFSQMFNVILRIVVKRDKFGKAAEVCFVHGLTALLSSHDFGLYEVFFRWMKDWFGEWKPAYVASDFEIAATAAFRVVWEGVCQISCKFHLSKGIRDRITKQGFMDQFIADPRSRRMLRFILAVAYLPTEEFAREVLEKFLLICKDQSPAEKEKPFYKLLMPYLQRTFIGILVKPSVPANGDQPAIPAVWKKARYSLRSWMRHEPTLQSWPNTTNGVESWHRMIKRTSCPAPGLWNHVDLIGHILELNRGRLRVIDALLEKKAEAEELDGMLDAYGVEFDEEELDEREDVKDGVDGHSPIKSQTRKPGKKIRWIHGISETSASVLKDNPIAVEYVSARLGAVERLKSGYLPLERARVDMEKPFLCIEEGVRKWLAYQDSPDLRYLYVRKIACLVSGFGTPKVFRMSRQEHKLFSEKFAKWSAFDYELGGEVDDDVDGVNDFSDCEDVVGEADAECKGKERRDSMAAGLMQSVPGNNEGEDEEVMAEAKSGPSSKSKGGKVAAVGGKVGKSKAGKVGAVAGKGGKAGAGKGVKELGAKVGKAPPVKTSKAAAGQGSGKESGSAGKKFDGSKTDKLASSAAKGSRDQSSDSEEERPLAAHKRVSGQKKGGSSAKSSRVSADGEVGTSGVGGGTGEVSDDAEEQPIVHSIVNKKKRGRKSFVKYSPKVTRSKAKFPPGSMK